MNIRELKLFRHLSNTLHFGRTSEACNITPSGLTRAMQRLEQELGQPLFHRNKRTVSLTPAGVLFKSYAEEAINRWTALQHTLAQDTLLRGELSLYCSVTAILSILPTLFSRFRKAHPEVQIHLQTGDAAKALYKLRSGEADITTAALEEKEADDMASIELTRTPLIFIGPNRFTDTIVRTQADEIDWQHTPIILAERGLSRERVERWFLQKNIRPHVYSQVAGNEAIIAMVAMGCGVGVVPQLVLDKCPLRDQVDVLDVTPRLQPFSVGVCTMEKNRRNPVVAAFWEIAAATAQSQTNNRKETL